MYTAGTRDYLCPVSTRALRTVSDYTESPDAPAPLEFLELVNELMEEHNLNFPENCEDTVLLYTNVVTLIELGM